MASGQGSGTINFGAFPGTHEASISVTGLTGISATSKAEAFILADSTTSDHTASDHRYLALFVALSCATPTGTECTVHARSLDKLQGTFLLNLVWAD